MDSCCGPFHAPFSFHCLGSEKKKVQRRQKSSVSLQNTPRFVQCSRSVFQGLLRTAIYEYRRDHGGEVEERVPVVFPRNFFSVHFGLFAPYFMKETAEKRDMSRSFRLLKRIFLDSRPWSRQNEKRRKLSKRWRQQLESRRRERRTGLRSSSGL